ncbi:MAG TPA: NADP-dependent oxidoreductase [Pyrinomonadaceae bacterium]|nr:NADP-dependent oxidoreductase [Pyrinomonadaceae bacterium]
MNRKIILAGRPTGMPSEDNFRIVDAEMPRPAEGEVLLKTLYLSVDPYMRGRMNEGKSYVAPFELNEVITGGVVGEVVESRSGNFQPGDIVAGYLGWELYSVAKGDEGTPNLLRKIDPAHAPVTTALGILGMPGLTAYFGLLDIGHPAAGETVVVSGAAGAVGMVVCQLAKIKGCRVVGIAGSDEKNKYLTGELGVDAAVNYKTSGDLARSLRDACPEGVDVYFDNVGGETSDTVLPLINHGARITICGQISLYNLGRMDVGPRPQLALLVKSASMRGFIISDYAARFAEGLSELGRWLAEGKLKNAENIVEGFENAPRAFLGLFAGENTGKQLVRVAAPGGAK